MAPAWTIVFALMIVAITVVRIILRSRDAVPMRFWSGFIFFSILVILTMLALAVDTALEIYRGQ